MEIIGNSSLWVEKYRPRTVKDLILPEKIKNFLQNIVETGEIPNLLLSGSAGRGKSSLALALCSDLKADKLFINASLETGIDVMRSKVIQFATTSSFNDGKKIVILDETDRLNPAAQDASKGVIEQTESNCRFILTTNNLSKIIDPIKSRCQLIDFNFSSNESQSLMVAFFKRICWILEKENIVFDKKILAEFVKTVYPDFRKTLNELQKFTKMFGKIDERIFSFVDQTIFSSLIYELKNKKFNNVRKLATEIDPDTFYGTFYNEIDNILEDSCKPNIILTLGKYAYESGISVNREITLMACLIEIMKEARFK